VTNLRTLVITGYGKRLHVDKAMFKVSGRNGEAISVNPMDIDTIVIDSSGVSISSSAIELAASAGIHIFILKGTRIPILISPVYSVMLPEVRKKQYMASESEIGCALAKALVFSKISNQSRALKRLGAYSPESGRKLKDLSKLSSFSKNVTEISCSENWKDKLRVQEAEAARSYWGTVALFLDESIKFEGRDPEGSDPFNASLNYIYALLYGESFRRLSIAGLDPFAGIFHEDRAGRKSLVYDFSDPLKPYLDYRLAKEQKTIASFELKDDLLSEEERKRLIMIYDSIRKSKVRARAEQPVAFSDAISSLSFSLAKAIRINDFPLNMMELDW
jgi:CRISPR-associated protein Cas1